MGNLTPRRREPSLAESAERDRIRLAKRSRDARDSAAEIGEISKPKDPERREKARQSLRYFLTEYFPNSTGLAPLCKDQLACVDRLEIALLEEGWIANIMPRGFIKSTMSENAMLWALLFGIRGYILFFAGTDTIASGGVDSVYRELVYNERLAEDFPEACEPFRALKGKAQRCRTQTYNGELTNIVYSGGDLRLAMIPGFAGSGGIIESYGLLSPPRGTRYKNEIGKQVRPDFAVLDDPQTDLSAKSWTQTNHRLECITNSISMMGAHGAELSMVMNATILREGDLADQISDPNTEAGANWQAVRSRMVKRMPDRLKDLWLGEYAKIRRTYDRSDPRGRIKARQRSTEFYRQNRAAMDAGAEVAWEHIGLEKSEISALQHALNILIDKGPKTFWAECQNAPLRPQVAAPLQLDKEDLLGRCNDYASGILPDGRSHVVFHMDVHDELLYYTVAGVGQEFSGDAIAYGTWPEQPDDWFNLRSADHTLSVLYPNVDSDTAIEMGIRDLLSRLLATEWRFMSGLVLPVSCGLVDAGYKPKQVANAIRAQKCTDRVMSSKGIGIGPTKKPMTEYDMSDKRVLRCGPDPAAPRWYYPIEHIDGGVLRVHFDSNFWKAVIASRLGQTSTSGAWRFWGDEHTPRGHYVSHMVSERPNQVTANGTTVNVFEALPGQDNHWWDTIVGCGVAASIMGCQLPSEPMPTDPPAPVAQESNIETTNFEEGGLTTRDGRPFFITARRGD